MKDNTKKKTPRVAIPSKKKPFQFFKEVDKMRGNQNLISPLTRKKLSK